MIDDPDYSPDSEYEVRKTNDPDGKKWKRMMSRIQHEKLRGSLDYDLFVIDPSNRDTTMDQFRDCLYDAIEQLKNKVDELEDKARHNG